MADENNEAKQNNAENKPEEQKQDGSKTEKKPAGDVENDALRSSDLEEVDLADEIQPKTSLSPEECKKERFKIIKNMIVISFGFLFLFTAFQSLQNLQSSLNPDEGLGLASLSVIYGALILSCMFVPPYMIGRLGCKWTLVLSMISYVLYTVANYYARWWTLIPASVLLGTYQIINTNIG